MPEYPATSAHPDLEALASYIDRRLKDGERAAVEAHIETCRECFELVSEVLQRQAEGVFAPPSRRVTRRQSMLRVDGSFRLDTASPQSDYPRLLVSKRLVKPYTCDWDGAPSPRRAGGCALRKRPAH